MTSSYAAKLTAVLGVAALPLAACGKPEQPPAPPPPRVGYVVVAEQPVTLTSELPGRTTAYETSDVRPQVNGLITARLFEEGNQVRKGQALYRIDPAPYQAQVASAQAALSRAQAAIASIAGAGAALWRAGQDQRDRAAGFRERADRRATRRRPTSRRSSAALRTAQIELGRTTVTRADLGPDRRVRLSPPARW